LSLLLAALCGSKVTTIDPALFTVCTAYPAEPPLTLFDPSVELAGFGPRGRVHLDWGIDNPAICFGDLFQVGVAQIHI
jgi:hypothetical protein